MLRSIERDAGRAFYEIGMPEVAADEPPSRATLEALCAAGHAWVAVDSDDQPVAYVLTTVVDDCLHVEQVSVIASYRGHGLGAALIDHVAAVAAAQRRRAVTLTTFRDVPWNAPYYRRLGFDVISTNEYGPQLRTLIAAETTSVPGDSPRVAMRRLLKSE